MSFGIPFRFLGSDQGERPSIVELAVRAGWVSVERPQFKDSMSGEIEAENTFPRYDSEEGFGMDIEFNVPIAKQLGYLSLRGQINIGFDPNPWVLSIAYTIPLASLAQALSGAGSSGR